MPSDTSSMFYLVVSGQHVQAATIKAREADVGEATMITASRKSHVGTITD